jgi:hypothetical protein
MELLIITGTINEGPAFGYEVEVINVLERKFWAHYSRERASSLSNTISQNSHLWNIP